MLRSGIGNVEHQTTFGVPESPLLRLPLRVRIGCSIQFVANSLLAIDCEADSRVHLRAPSAHCFDGDGCPSDDGLQVGGESIARGGNINWLTWICLNRVVKAADSRGDAHDPPSAMVLQSPISSWQECWHIRQGPG